MDCPGCDSRLVQVDQEGIQIDVCTTCRGTWFDAGELEQLQKKRPVELLPHGGEIVMMRAYKWGVRDCPACKLRSLPIGELRGHRVGKCGSCSGVWVALGKLAVDASPSPFEKLLYLALLLS